MPIKKTAPALLAALALAASLAACSGGGDEGNASSTSTGANPDLSDVFDWTSETHGPVKTIEFAFPDELAAIAPEVENLIAVPTSATARELDSASLCAVDVSYDFPQGVDAVAGGAGMSEDGLRDEAAILAWGQYGKFQGDGVTNADEQREWLVQQKTEDIRKIEESTGVKQDIEGGVAAEMEIADQAFEERLEELRQAQGSKQGRTDGQSLLGSEARPVEEMDGSDEGVFYSDDLKTITYVMGCTADASDPEGSNLKTIFDTSKVEPKENGNPDVFAEARIAVMANGDLLIYDAEVRHYETDSNGDWIED